jgi:hypothetical protein
MAHCLARIDAIFENADGSPISRITLFSKTDGYRLQMRRLVEYGWKLEEKQVDVSELEPLERAALIGPIWPLIPLREIIELVRFPPVSNDTVYEPKEDDSP